MLRVAVSGYYGFNNTGDEAILLSLVTTMRTLAQGVEITVLSNSPRETRQLYGIKAVNRWNPFAAFWVLLRSDLLISGGGGLLQDVTGIRSVCYYLAVVMIAKLLGKPVVYFAQGVGPIRSAFGRWLTRVVSNRVELITVRDQASKDDFLAMGVIRPPIVVTADPVLALSPQQAGSEAGEALLAGLRARPPEPVFAEGEQCCADDDDTERPACVQAAPDEAITGKAVPAGEAAGAAVPGPTGDGADRPILGVILRDWQDCAGFKRVVAEAADRLVYEGWEVVLVPFHYPRDLQVCREVSWLMQKPKLLVREKLSVDTLFSLLGQMDLVLGMRLHALVMASVMRTPSVGITYDPKVARFLEMTGLPVAGTVTDLESEKLYQELTGAWEQRQEIVNHLDQILVSLRQQAWETTSLVLSVFYSRYPHRRGEVGHPAQRYFGEFFRAAPGKKRGVSK